MDVTESGLCSVAGFGISGFETPDCVTREIVSHALRKYVLGLGRNGSMGQ